MIAYFEQTSGTATVLPDDPVERILVALVEDYCDEWLWRPAMWWRSMPEESRRTVGRRIADEVLAPIPLPSTLLGRLFAARQRHAWLEGDGMHAGIAWAIRDVYQEELETLEALLERRPFLLGDRPSLVDFGYFGPMFRHFACDPDPARVMRDRAPRVAAWVERVWADRASEFPTRTTFEAMQRKRLAISHCRRAA